MTARTATRLRRSQQRHRRLATVLCASLAITGCGTAHSGTAVPDGAAVAEYVGTKFESALNDLSKDIARQVDKKVRIKRYIRLDERWLDTSIEGARRGSPPERAVKILNNKTPADQRVLLEPAGSEVEYMLLGGVYSQLAPTPWITLPNAADGWECTWSGAQDACKIAQAISETIKKDARAVLSARSAENGDVEVLGEMSYDAFFASRVIALPQDAVEQIRENFGDRKIKTRLLLTAEGKVKEVALEDKASTDAHKLELEMSYTVLGEPSDSDFPPKPKKKDVTALRTKAEVDKFYAGLDKLHGQ
ncbi:MAG: hypothetical protein GEU86_12285 [Actinophytocola sp.]|nr:hypothetical protein [Actinophytocola sp.]